MWAAVRFRHLAVSAVVLAAGCSSSLDQRLRPADGAHRLKGWEWSAVDGDNQIEVIAQTGVWPGDARLLDLVEPIRVRIGNYGDRPVHLHYDRIRLLAADGRSYAPLSTDAARSGSTSTPRFKHRKFAVAPYYGEAYGSVPVYTGSFLGSTRARGRLTPSSDFPTVEMVDWSIPEGVIDVSGHVDGYLFFAVPAELERAHFQAVLVAPRGATGKRPSNWVASPAKYPHKAQAEEPVARVSIPFVAE